MKPYDFEVNLTFTMTIRAVNQKSAIDELKESFKNDYGIVLSDDEIKLLNKEVKNDNNYSTI